MSIYMSTQNSDKFIDANILLEYIMPETAKGKDQHNKVKKLLNPSNPGYYHIRIFTYTLGEAFTRLLNIRDGKSLDFSDNSLQKKYNSGSKLD
ncbi:hypothetical protein OXIME_001091 [Oxyplasma meridianum]|uniref:PIN domain-containing protein n=1 Tax=Oxyplasma meridianum TaxID=3073602 RepID=A0AAX4NHD7_9ARCH